MMLDKMQIEKIVNLNKQLNEDIGKLQIENDVLLAKNNLLQEENEKLKSDWWTLQVLGVSNVIQV